MAGEGYLAAGVLQVAVAVSFLVVGRNVLRRAPTQPAVRAFVVWWWSLGLFLAIQGALDLAAARSGPELGLYILSRYPSVPLLCVASGGLSYFTLFLVTGRLWVARLSYAVYGAALALLWVATFLPAPTALRADPWEIAPATAHPLLPAVYLVIGLPMILGSASILVVSWGTEGPQGRRGRLVGTALLVYVGSGLVSYLALGPVPHFAVLVGGGAGAAILSLRAYPPSGRTDEPPARALRRSGLLRRCSELV